MNHRIPAAIRAASIAIAAPARRKFLGAIAAAGMAALIGHAALADDAELRIGNTMAYSGPAAPYAALGKSMAAYFDTVNRAGGIDGHKIKFISLDDAYTPAKTVEQTRKLVEQDHVAMMFASLGTPTSLAVRKYLNEHRIPQLGVLSGAAAWNDPKHYPYSMSGIVDYTVDGKMVGLYLLKHKPDAKIAVLYQNDDFGRDHLGGLKTALGDKAQSMIVTAASYEATDTTVDSQVIELRASGADVLYLAAVAKPAAQAIRKADALGWKPLRFLTYTATPVSVTPALAGFKVSTGLISHNSLKDPQDPTWANDPEMRGYVDWMNKNYPAPDIKNGFIYAGWALAAGLVEILKQAHGDLTGAGIMKAATHLHDFHVPGALPGLSVSTSPDNYQEFQFMRDMEFNGDRWVLLPSENM